ncbi:hypothetical protein HanPI659440_Chr12g0468341 [Helianthus annuus]|nr:hypothetical protein HanPI659440_Chr12g0468341 [Helianthus annuus]
MHHHHYHQHISLSSSLPLSAITSPHTTIIFDFDLAIPSLYKGEGSRIRKLGAYGLPRTSLRCY